MLYALGFCVYSLSFSYFSSLIKCCCCCCYCCLLHSLIGASVEYFTSLPRPFARRLSRHIPLHSLQLHSQVMLLMLLLLLVLLLLWQVLLLLLPLLSSPGRALVQVQHRRVVCLAVGKHKLKTFG